MMDPTDSVIDEVEAEMSNKRGARDRVFFLAAIVGEKGKKAILAEPIKASNLEEAKMLFEEQHGVPPSYEDAGEGNGFYVAKGTGISDAQRISVTVSPAQLARRTTAVFRGQFRGWHVWCSGLAGCKVEGVGEFKENELVSVEFESRIDASAKTPKPKLKKREVIRLKDVENVQKAD